MSLTAYVPSTESQISHDAFVKCSDEERAALRRELRHPIAIDAAVCPRRGHDGKLGYRRGHFFLNGRQGSRVPWPEDVEFDPEYGEVIEGVEYVTRYGESLQHRAGKIYVEEVLLDDLPEARVSFEKRLVLPDGRIRIADVYVELPDGDQVYEVQLSSIPLSEIYERTNDYNDLNLASWWLIGGACAKRSDIRDASTSAEIPFSFLDFRKTYDY